MCSLSGLTYIIYLFTDLVKKVLKLVGQHLNIENELSFLESNLSFIISDWFEKYGYSNLNEFPWTLLNNISQNDFLLKYSPYIVPVLLFNLKSEVFQDLSNKLKKSPSKLIKVFPNLIFFVLK